VPTSRVENLFSLVTLVYCSKANFLGSEAMFTRMACACMDHNANANRPQKINRDGTPAFRTKVDRARRKEVAVKVRVKKDYSFRNEIWAMVNQCAETNMVPDCKPPAIAAKQRTTVGKEVLVATHVSRMKKK